MSHSIAGISASGTKIPIMFIGKGKTDFVENSQIGDVGPHWKDHSESCWVTEEVFINYLKKLREHFGGTNGPKLHLILDVYPSHRTDDVKNFAVGLNINLIYVPAGLTDEYQPLDRYVFGCLKSTARRLFRQRVRNDPNVERTKQDAVEDFICVWEALSYEIISIAWCFDADEA